MNLQMTNINRNYCNLTILLEIILKEKKQKKKSIKKSYKKANNINMKDNN